MGQMLARLFVTAGHQVQLANSRGPASLALLIEELGSNASAGNASDLVSSDVIVLAVPWARVPAAIAGLGDVAGKIVIDATNNRVGPRPEDIVNLGQQSSSDVVAALLPGARLVKAFNHQPIAALGGLQTTGRIEPYALFVAGDDAETKGVVARLIRDIGGEPIDTGSIGTGGRLQATGGPLAGHGRLLGLSEARTVLAEANRAETPTTVARASTTEE